MSSARNLCPLCGIKPAAPAHAPFCSQGCRDRDLLKWLGDGYAIPGPSLDEELDSTASQSLASQTIGRRGLDNEGDGSL